MAMSSGLELEFNYKTILLYTGDSRAAPRGTGTNKVDIGGWIIKAQEKSEMDLIIEMQLVEVFPVKICRSDFDYYTDLVKEVASKLSKSIKNNAKMINLVGCRVEDSYLSLMNDGFNSNTQPRNSADSVTTQTEGTLLCLEHRVLICLNYLRASFKYYIKSEADGSQEIYHKLQDGRSKCVARNRLPYTIEISVSCWIS
ncbi:hypothetical protein Bca52824_029066 [Brassica carinata]|uniref:Uncharacterized protein n=1 Tax=Brassica carinata TaxID=52824 RepID=A0A8X7VDA9_BRACI|nr:hypothetical protein Bca52824_029066 [Brassica carinata]